MFGLGDVKGFLGRKEPRERYGAIPPEGRKAERITWCFILISKAYLAGLPVAV